VYVDEVSHGPLGAADDAVVHHHRPVLTAVRAHVLQAEPLGLVEVHLDGRQAGLPFRAVGDLDVDLGAVEGGLARLGIEVDSRTGEHVGEDGGGPVPQLALARVLTRRAGQREPVPHRFDAERAVRLPDQAERRRGLGGDLVRAAEDVRVVQRDRPHPGQPAQHAGQLGPVHPAKLGDPQRQLAVAAAAGPVDQRVVRAQARPQHHLLAADIHRRVHAVPVMRPVPGNLVQLALGQDRGVDVLVTGLPLQLPDVLLERVPDGGARGKPVRQPGADQRIGVE